MADLTGPSHSGVVYPSTRTITIVIFANEQKESIMSAVEQRTCAHIPCGCPVPPGEKYCGESCRDAGSHEVEIECECLHSACIMADEKEKIA